MIGWQEIVVIALVVLVLFGAKRIPELARSLGRASYEFKKAKNQLEKETDDLVNSSERRAEAEDAATDKVDSAPAKDDKPQEKKG
ncbi:MAG: twin-arginine translocase TatA/TatE family subunit [Victivallaceae bacterium]|nr:twin-arginine translocase TatA/TatE family subunit [Victivallaceae bacterium]